MNTIKLTVELCAEDRARLDRIFSALESCGTPYSATLEAAVEPQEAPKEEPKAEPTPEAELPGQMSFEESAPAEPAKVVELSDIQKKVVELSAAGKKAEVREIVKKYADRVSAIPADKTAEVWEQLTALEG